MSVAFAIRIHGMYLCACIRDVANNGGNCRWQVAVAVFSEAVK